MSSSPDRKEEITKEEEEEEARLLFSYYFDSLTIISRFPQLFRFPNNILARHMVDSYSLGEFPRLSLFQR